MDFKIPSKSMLDRIRIVSKKSPKLIDETQLSFEIQGDYPDTVLSVLPNHKAIGKSGSKAMYFLATPKLSQSDNFIMRRAKAHVVSELSVKVCADVEYKPQLEDAMRLAANFIKDYSTSESVDVLAYIVAHDTAGFGPISILLEDRNNIEEIMINSPKSAITVYHSDYGYCSTNMRFNSEASMRYTLNRLLQETSRELSPELPIIDARLSNGFRMHAQTRPYSQSGTMASIRVDSGRSLDVQKLMQKGSATPQSFAYLWLAIDAGLNIVIAGSPSAGKTSLTKALLVFVPSYERVITVEDDVSELYGSTNILNSVSLVGDSHGKNTTIKDQIINALRLRPNRLVIGEVRGHETAEVFAGANFGMPFMTTIHCDAAADSIVKRLSTPPMSVPEASISMLDVSVFIQHIPGKHREISKIREYNWLARDEISLNELKSEHQLYKSKELLQNGNIDIGNLINSKALRSYASKWDITPSESLNEFYERTNFLSHLMSEARCDNVWKRIDDYTMARWI